MSYFSKYLEGFFIGRNFYYGLGTVSLLFVVSYFIPILQSVAYFAFLALVIFSAADYAALFLTRREFPVQRNLPARLNNGEENTIEWTVKNEFNFPVKARLIDEWPEQLEIRDQSWTIHLAGRQQKKLRWQFRPVLRGSYHFGDVHLFVSTPLNILVRRFTTPAEQAVPCYPAFVRLNQYSLMANTVLHHHGAARTRRIGQSMEFEQIKEYVTGDDIRTLNWKASARRQTLMVNQYAQERAQQVYCIIDKGRLMKMPFGGMSLLDYAINATLIMSSVCLDNRDKTGLITFSNEINTLLAADNRRSQLATIMDALYKEETVFPESDFELLYHTVRQKIRNRSLLILFTNFESVTGLERQMHYIRFLAKYHLLVVVFFENTELKSLIKTPANTIDEVYVKTIAGKFALEKKIIASELTQYGIATILTKPADLTVKAVNKYLELKVKSAL